MLTPDQAQELKDAGLDYYNHNLDTSPEFTANHHDAYVPGSPRYARRGARRRSRCAAEDIVGMGESSTDRASLLLTLANLPEHPESVPINQLVESAWHPTARRRRRRPGSFCPHRLR